MSKLVKRAALAAAVAGSLTGLVAAPATAAAAPILAPAISTPTLKAYNVAPNCNSGPGVTTNLNQVTYSIYGTASGYTTTTNTAVATGITCWVKDAVTGVVYGTISQALPGSVAAVAGTITVPFNSYPVLCARGNALFSNNTTATYTTYGC